MCRDVAQTGFRPVRRGRTLGMFLVWALFTGAGFAAVAPITGFGNVFPIVAVYLISAAALCWIWWRTFRASLWSFLGPAVAVMASTAVLIATTHALSSYLNAHPPQRPMFHNRFAGHERSLMPYWHGPQPVADELGNLAWPDHKDNVLVVLADESPDGSIRTPVAGEDEARFRLRGGPRPGYVTVGRTQNALIVIAQDSSTCRFPLKPDLARDFDEKWRTTPCDNLFARLNAHLSPMERRRLKAFLSKNTTPKQ